MEKNILKNERGSALMLVTIAAGVGVVLSLGMLNLNISQLNASRTTIQNYEAKYVEDEVRSLLADTGNCSENFRNKPTSSMSKVGVYRDLKNSAKRNVFSVGDSFAQGQLSLAGIHFGHSASAKEPAVPANGSGISYVTLVFNRSSGYYIGAQQISRRFQVVVENSSGRVSSCSLTGASGESFSMDAANFTEVKSPWSKSTTDWAQCPKGAVVVSCSSEVNSKDAKSNHYDSVETRSTDKTSCRSVSSDGKDKHRAVAWCFSPERLRVTTVSGGSPGGSIGALEDGKGSSAPERGFGGDRLRF